MASQKRRSAPPPPAPAEDGPAPLASLRRRFLALLVDWLLCLAIGGLFGPLTGSYWPPLVLVAEYAFFVGLFGQTPGMYLLRLRCVADGSGGRLGVPRAALRGLLLALLIPAVVMDERQRGLHDRLVGSVVLPAGPR